jgi:hypothetical protein
LKHTFFKFCWPSDCFIIGHDILGHAL